MRRLRVVAVSVALTLVSLSACTASETSTPSVSVAVTKPTSTPSATAGRPSSSAPTATPEPTLPLTPAEDVLFEDLTRTTFGNPTTIDGRWFPLVPGTRFVYKGTIIDDGRVPHTVVFTVTDLTKVVDGVRAVVAYDQDATNGQIVEREISFFAQDDAGNVWLLGEHPEEYEDGEFNAAPTWISGQAEAHAGILIRAEPAFGASWPQGWGPAVGWTDRARVFETGSSTCVPAGCYHDVLVIDEFNPEEPDAHQLKYYAPGVGNVRVGWAGARDEDHEVLELMGQRVLPAAELEQVDREALRLERHAYQISDVYAATEPIQRG